MEKKLEHGSPSALPSRAPSAAGKGGPPLSLSRTWPPFEEIPSFWTANPGQHSAQNPVSVATIHPRLCQLPPDFRAAQNSGFSAIFVKKNETFLLWQASVW